jgi:hypothetical protein
LVTETIADTEGEFREFHRWALVVVKKDGESRNRGNGSAKGSGMTREVDWESPEREPWPDRENLLREAEVLDHPETVTEQDLVGAGILRISAAADRVMVDADGACLVVHEPLSTIRRQERGMVMPLVGGGAAFTPTGSQENDPIREVPRET